MANRGRLNRKGLSALLAWQFLYKNSDSASYAEYT